LLVSSLPEGGFHAVPRALAGAAHKHGVGFRYGVEVTSIERSGARAVAAHTSDGGRITGDVFVLNPDLPMARRDLLGDPLRRRPRFSPSCYLLLAGSTASFGRAAHHNIHFGAAWREVFEDLAAGRLMRDPWFLVSVPTRSDPSLAPPGRHVYYVLLPTPNLEGPLDWTNIAASYRDHVIETLEQRGYPGFEGAIELSHTTSPSTGSGAAWRQAPRSRLLTRSSSSSHSRHECVFPCIAVDEEIDPPDTGDVGLRFNAPDRRANHREPRHGFDG
jgi:phytoene desaturase